MLLFELLQPCWLNTPTTNGSLRGKFEGFLTVEFSSSERLTEVLPEQSVITNTEMKRLVTRFFGFALKGVTDKWRRLAGHGDNDDGGDEVVHYCESDALAFVEDC